MVIVTSDGDFRDRKTIEVCGFSRVGWDTTEGEHTPDVKCALNSVNYDLLTDGNRGPYCVGCDRHTGANYDSGKAEMCPLYSREFMLDEDAEKMGKTIAKIVLTRMAKNAQAIADRSAKRVNELNSDQ